MRAMSRFDTVGVMPDEALPSRTTRMGNEAMVGGNECAAPVKFDKGWL
jgi:hypothetical protein